MDAPTRRSHLVTTDNPQPRLDYLISLSGPLGVFGHVGVRYVPDRLILTPDSFASYLVAIGAFDWRHLEEAGAAILSDLNNELVARWVQVALARGAGNESRHQVLLEDRQPNWDNSALLSRLNVR